MPELNSRLHGYAVRKDAQTTIGVHMVIPINLPCERIYRRILVMSKVITFVNT
jgi:hypothetical protein